MKNRIILTILISTGLSLSGHSQTQAPDSPRAVTDKIKDLAGKVTGKGNTSAKEDDIGKEDTVKIGDVAKNDPNVSSEGDDFSGLDKNDPKLKELSFSEVTSYKVARDTENCTVVKGPGTRFQPFDLTLKRSAAKIDFKATEINEEVQEAAQHEAQRYVENSANDPQIKGAKADMMNKSASKAVTVRSKFLNKVSQSLYGVASLNSYLKDLELSRKRKLCHKEVEKLERSACDGQAHNVKTKLLSRDVTLGEIESSEKENRYNDMVSGVRVAGNCGFDDVVKKCQEYIKELSQDLVFCKESLPSQNSKESKKQSSVMESIIEFFISKAYAGREETFGSYGSAILNHIESDPNSNSQHFITDPYNRGSLSYELSKVKESANSGYDHLKNVQEDNIDTIENLVKDMGNLESVEMPKNFVIFREASELTPDLGLELDNLVGKEALDTRNLFRDVDDVDKAQLNADPSILGATHAKRVTEINKEAKAIIDDFKRGQGFSPESIERQKKLNDKLEYIKKLNEKLKDLAEKNRDDLQKNGKTAYEKPNFIKKMRQIFNSAPADLLGRNNAVASDSREKSGNNNRAKTVTETITNKTSKIDLKMFGSEGSEKENMEGIVTDASQFDLLTGRNIAEMRAVNLSDVTIHNKPHVSIFQIISQRYLKTGLNRLQKTQSDVTERFNLNKKGPQ